MPNPYPFELRERAVRAYEAGDATYVEVAEQFGVDRGTLIRWVQLKRTGSVTAREKGGGWVSPIDLVLLHRLVGERPDTTDGRVDPSVQPRDRVGGPGPSGQCAARAAAQWVCLQEKRSRPV